MNRDESLRWVVISRDGLICAKCSFESDQPEFFDVDHIIPLARGGEDTPENAQVLCVACHRKKGVFIELPLSRRTIDVRKSRDIGDVIQLVREHRGMTQSELAHETACDRFYLGKIEAGVQNMFLTRLLRILKYLGVTVSLTFGDLQAV